MLLPLLLPLVSASAPTGLMVDFKSSPSVGVSASPSFSWIVPHLPSPADGGCLGITEHDQLQHSYQLPTSRRWPTTPGAS